MNIIASISCRTSRTDKRTDKCIQGYDHIVTECMSNMLDSVNTKGRYFVVQSRSHLNSNFNSKEATNYSNCSLNRTLKLK